MVHPDDGILLSIAKKWGIKSRKKKKKNHGGNLMRITKGKEPMCMIPTIWLSEKGKAMETIKRTVVAEVSWGGNKGYLGRL